jgi:hypothetical protein
MMHRRGNVRRSIRLLSLPVLALALGAALALPATSASAQTVYEFANAWDNLCLTNGGNNDVYVIQTTCSSSPDDEWFTGVGIEVGTVTIQNAHNNDQCLGVAGNSKSEGALVMSWTCNGSPTNLNQSWYEINCNGVGEACQFQNANSGLLLSIDGCNDDNGDYINQWGSVSLPGGFCQWWNFPRH